MPSKERLEFLVDKADRLLLEKESADTGKSISAILRDRIRQPYERPLDRRTKLSRELLEEAIAVYQAEHGSLNWAGISRWLEAERGVVITGRAIGERWKRMEKQSKDKEQD